MILGGSGAALGSFWTALGGCWAAQGGPWAVFGRLWATPGEFEQLTDCLTDRGLRSGSVSGWSWSGPGAVLARSVFNKDLVRKLRNLDLASWICELVHLFMILSDNSGILGLASWSCEQVSF